LTQEGLSLDQYRQMMERTMIKTRVQQDEVMPHASLTDEEARQYYQKHPDEFTKPPTVMLREIFVPVPTQARGRETVFNAEVDNAAKEKITAARDRVRKGEDFAKVAAEVSESATKDKGGLIGPINLNDMDPALREVIDKLKPGEAAEPIRTAAGYQLFALESRAEAQLEAFDKVRDLISQKVYAERLDGETKKYIDKLRAQALIEWKHDDMRKLYEKAIADAKAKS
jgi:parvulin-like peptidyl-prolyl isomerase